MKEFFPGIPMVLYEGSYSTNPFAFHFYEPERIVAGKPMREYLQFVLPLHKLLAFVGAQIAAKQPAQKEALHACMELMHKLGLTYFSLSDASLTRVGGSLRENNGILDEMLQLLFILQSGYHALPMVFTADLTSDPRYVRGAATSPSADVFALAAAQTKKAVECAARIGARYFCLDIANDLAKQNTRDTMCVNQTLENRTLAAMLSLLENHAKAIGFNGRLALQTQQIAGAARYTTLRNAPGDRLTMQKMTLSMLDLLHSPENTHGGIALEVSQKKAHTPEDLCVALILYMDRCALGLLLANRLRLDGRLEQFTRERYCSYEYGTGKSILDGTTNFDALELYVMQKNDIPAPICRDDYLESVLFSLIHRGN
ncbi:MAG: hypothetical protein LBB67_07995 [Oscillospiraceae bacterium]|nr:hypothetical protein [Oscillospiraceae bacterium]